MKQTLLFIFFFSVIQINFAQNCNAPQVLLEHYFNDVKSIALERMEQFNAPELDQITIPEIYSDLIMKGLAAIYNSNIPEKTMVFDKYCIHHWTTYSPISIYIKLDPTASWYNNWENNDITTGIQEIDSLFNLYGFENIKLNFRDYDVFLATTNQRINLKAFTDKLSNYSKIIIAERIPNLGSGNTIYYNYIDGIQYFDFQLAWGDCPAGCTIFYNWKFSVDENCQATLLKSEGTPILFNGFNCNISGNYNNPLTIFASNNIFCIGDSSVLSVNKGDQFLWSTGETTSTITVKEAGDYSITITDEDYVDYASINIQMPTPYINFPKIKNNTFCYSDNPIELKALPNNGVFAINNQTIGNEFIPSQLNIGKNTISYTRLDTTSGCYNTIEQDVIVYQDTTEIEGEELVCIGSRITLNACTDVFNCSNWRYKWNDGSDERYLDVTEKGKYSVAIWTTNGCIQHAEKTIEEVEPPEVSFLLEQDTFYLHDPKVKLKGGLPKGGTYFSENTAQNYFEPYKGNFYSNLVYYKIQDSETGCFGYAYQHITILDDHVDYDVSKEGNQWNIANQLENDTTTLMIRVKGDTLIKNVLYRKLQMKEKLTSNWQAMDKYIRQDSMKRVFTRTKTKPAKLLYNFGYRRGEILYENEVTHKKIWVKDIDYIVDLNNKVHKELLIKTKTTFENQTETWIEGIGSIRHLFENDKIRRYRLLCFSQNGDVIYQPNQECYINTITGITDIENRDIKLSPNPTSNTFKITGLVGKIEHIELYDMNGKLIKYYSAADEFDISSLSAGIYIVKITSDNNLISKKLVKGK